MIKLFDLDVIISDCLSVKGKISDVNMLSFVGQASGNYFSGTVIGTGVDTQLNEGDKMLLSARYILEGTDKAGNRCRIFVQNEGSFENGFSPKMITDSSELSFLETSRVTANVIGRDGGALISFFIE